MRSLLKALLVVLTIAEAVKCDGEWDAQLRFEQEAFTSCYSIQEELSSQLSRDSAIHLPGNGSFDALQIRASSPHIKPNLSAIVEVATGEDVQHLIKYANKCDIPFLAVSGGHGWQSTLNDAAGGIQINMRKLQQISLSEDEQIVHAGGGVLQRRLTQTLFEWDKQPVTGLCECTSVIGPLLGGGHSVLQGFHGFAADNLVSAEVVLADGTAVTASSTENEDLFWALRGAGQNFGIVTSFEIKLFDLPKATWTIISLIYTQDKLGYFIDALNEVDNGGDHAPQLVLSGAILRIPDFDSEHPVIAFQVKYLGATSEAETYVERFRQAEPIFVSTAENTAYKDYYQITDNGYNQTACHENENISGYAVSLSKYNVTATREAFTYLNELTADERFAKSVWLLESYGSRGVWAQDYDVTAVPAVERDMPILTPIIIWWPGESAEAADRAAHYGRKMQEVLAAGDGLTPESAHVYVNYAIGGESLQQMYGEDKLARLKALKWKYDPGNRFGYYMPLL